MWSKIRLYLTWKIRKNLLSLICKVDQLVYEVMILDAEGKEQAVCLIPSSKHQCHTHLENANTYQNLKTNTTTMTISINSRSDVLTGNWTCLHGTNEQANTEINIYSTTGNKYWIRTKKYYYNSIFVGFF